MYNLRKIILQKGFAVGSWINTASPIVAEIMAGAEFDFLTVDIEHSPIDIPQAINIFQAIKSVNDTCYPIVRLQGNLYAENKRYLDAGAVGLIAPLIKTKEEALNLVKSAKYPPLGERGLGYCRANAFGFSIDSYIKTANDDTFVCVQIEHIDSVDNIDEIFSVKGLDAAFIGPYDLTASMGIPGEFENNSYLETLKKILTKCKEYKIIAGLHVVQPDPNEVVERVNEGFQMIAYSLDITMIGLACRKGITEIRKSLGR